jgi:hypothetical protein
MNDIRAALAGPLPTEIAFSATVLTPPRFFMGSRTHAEHEAFDCRTADGTRLEIVDNVALAPRIPVGPGDRIAVRGELVHDEGREPVVHWTHHDPAGRHAAGWIDLAGKRYA